MLNGVEHRIEKTSLTLPSPARRCIHSSQILVPNSVCELIAAWEDKAHHSNAGSYEMEISWDDGYALTFTSQARGVSCWPENDVSRSWAGYFDPH